MLRYAFFLACSLSFLLLESKPAQSQKSFQLTAAGAGQNTWMFNKDDSDEGESLDYQPTFGAAFGVKAGYFFNESIGIESGFIFSQQGQNYKHQIETRSGKETYFSGRSLTYYKIPLLLHFRSQPSETAYFTATLGPQISLLGDFSQTADEGFFQNAWGEKKDYSSTTMDVVLGFGPGFSLSRNIKLDVQFRFDYSFSDAEDKDEGWSDDRASTNNVTGGLQLGFTYGFGGSGGRGGTPY